MNLSELSKSEVAYIETMYRLKETNDAASVSVLVAESVMHQHRIVELYFNTKLGLDSEVSCAEASKVDYLLDNVVVEKMCAGSRSPEPMPPMAIVSNTRKIRLVAVCWRLMP